MSAGFQTAIEREIVWKNDELKNFCVELVQAALASDQPTFTTDIVPDSARSAVATGGSPGTGIAGSAAHILKTASVIEHVGHEHAGKFFPDKVVSTREGRNAAHLCVYRLTSASIAREFLRRHSLRRATVPEQTEFFAPPRPAFV